MVKENSKPFYTTEKGCGVIMDGGCGYQLLEMYYNEKTLPCLSILPLKYKQEAGEIREDNEVILDQGFVNIAFGSEKSLDVFIEVLQDLKTYCKITKKL